MPPVAFREAVIIGTFGVVGRSAWDCAPFGCLRQGIDPSLFELILNSPEQRIYVVEWGTMSRTIHTRFVWLACLAIAVAGCHSANAPPPDVKAIDITPTAAVAAAVDQPAKPTLEPTPVVAMKAAAPRTFSPPFPDRTDLFQPPKRAEGAQHRSESTDGLVELKGFVDVGEPHVVLSIDGAIAPLPVGGEKYGVQVISIKPPSVVLQRGRSRWTASLE